MGDSVFWHPPDCCGPYSCDIVAKLATRLATTSKSRSTLRPAGHDSDARERILATAYSLFSRHGIRAVGVDTIVADADVAKMTFYRHFPSKDDLVLEFLERRERLWTQDWLQLEVERRASTPANQLLAIFDVFGTWFKRPDFEGCSFINVLLETAEARHPVRQATVVHLARIRQFLQGLAKAAGIANPDDFARKWHILMKGSIVAAGEGDTRAAQRARDVGFLLLKSEGVSFSEAESSAPKRQSNGHHRPVSLRSKAEPSKKR